jgi:hypothetical protein
MLPEVRKANSPCSYTHTTLVAHVKPRPTTTVVPPVPRTQDREPAATQYVGQRARPCVVEAFSVETNINWMIMMTLHRSRDPQSILDPGIQMFFESLRKRCRHLVQWNGGMTALGSSPRDESIYHPA